MRTNIVKLVVPFIAVAVSAAIAAFVRWVYLVIAPVDQIYQSALGGWLFIMWVIVTVYAVGIVVVVWEEK